jgi:hypothetical protein
MKPDPKTAKAITEYAQLLQETVPYLNVTVILRDPRLEVSIDSVIVVSNDNPQKVLEVVMLQAAIQPAFKSGIN